MFTSFTFLTRRRTLDTTMQRTQPRAVAGAHERKVDAGGGGVEGPKVVFNKLFLGSTVIHTVMATKIQYPFVPLPVTHNVHVV